MPEDVLSENILLIRIYSSENFWLLMHDVINLSIFNDKPLKVQLHHINEHILKEATRIITFYLVCIGDNRKS